MNTTIPALPKIEGPYDIILDLYCHHSLKGSNIMNEEYGDVDRLAELGGRTLDMVLAFHYFQKRPLLVAEQISVRDRSPLALPSAIPTIGRIILAKAVSDAKLKEWLTAYNIKSSFRAAPGACEILESPRLFHEMRKFFNAYIGGLHTRNGLSHVQAWISALVDPDANANSFGSPPPSIGYAPAAFGPWLRLCPLHGGGASEITLSMGLRMRPIWKVDCLVNGIKKGEGTGKNQKQAKEEAGRMAYRAMGW
ncbi:hypothetical protein C8R46DRAFT_1217632 [Mycena filopes]|nr:hypothetical protein C8R46DRAFT_1217632 [Mycena filopes]